MPCESFGVYPKQFNVCTSGIDLKSEEDLEKLAKLYWNRACYKSLTGAELGTIVADLKEAVRLKPQYRNDLVSDSDLARCLDSEDFKRLATPAQ